MFCFTQFPLDLGLGEYGACTNKAAFGTDTIRDLYKLGDLVVKTIYGFSQVWAVSLGHNIGHRPSKRNVMGKCHGRMALETYLKSFLRF